MVADEFTSPAETGFATVTGSVGAALLGGAGGGLLLHVSGRMEILTGLVGLERAVGGWIAYLFVVAAAGTAFALTVSFVATGLRRRYVLERPFSMVYISAIVGALFGLTLWGVAVALVLPFWMEAAMGIERPVPYVHASSLVGFSLFGVALGGSFPLLYRVLVPLEP